MLRCCNLHTEHLTRWSTTLVPRLDAHFVRASYHSVRIITMHKLIISLSLIFITTCAVFNTDTTLRSDTKILENNVGSTKLILNEDYRSDGHFIPKGRSLGSV